MSIIDSSDLTIVTACRNRNFNLSKTLPSWLAINPACIFICDWGSTVPLSLDLLGVSQRYSAKINIFRVDADVAKSWVLTWAFNEALAKVDTPYTLKLDCDHEISIDFLVKNPIEITMFSRGHSRYAERGQEYINGAFFSCTELLRLVGYYDERITTYGWEDSDLYSRLYDACSKSSILAKNSIFHIDQDEEARTSNQIVSKEAVLADTLGIRVTEFLITRNRILCGMLWPWSRRDYINRLCIRGKFYNLEPDQMALYEHATLKAFDLHYDMKNLELASNLTSSEAYSRALYASEFNDSCVPLATGIAQMLKMYADAVKVGDSRLQGMIRHLLSAKNLPNDICASRMNSLDSIDKIYSKDE